MTRLVIIGPPGAGKGTQARGIADRFGIPAISTGDIFRENVANKTDLGLEAKRYMDAGQYVPDDLTNALVRSRLGEPDASRGFLLDGYPRTTDQVRELDEILADNGVSLDAVIELEADQEVVIQRLLGRAAEQGRSDDTEDVIRTRLQVYAKQTAGLIDAYGERGLIVAVNGIGSVAEVGENILAGLAARGLTGEV